MHKTAFSERIDLPRLENCRKEVFNHVLYDPYLERGRLEWATVGDGDIPFEKALTEPSAILAETDKMVANGRFVFTYKSLHHPSRFRVAIEKYEIRKKLFGTVYGFRAGLSFPDNGNETEFLVGRSLPDLNAKVYDFTVLKKEPRLLADEATTVVMASW